MFTSVLLAAALAVSSPPLVAPLTIAPPPPAAVKTTTSRYGYQILLADGLILGTAIAAGDATPLLLMAATGPVIHLMHGHKGRALASGIARTALPLGGVLL